MGANKQVENHYELAGYFFTAAHVLQVGAIFISSAEYVKPGDRLVVWGKSQVIWNSGLVVHGSMAWSRQTEYLLVCNT